MKYVITSILCILLQTAFSQNAIEIEVSKIHQKEGLHGVILVAKNGEILYQEAFGIADYRFNIPNSIDSKFLVGSITKQFTATLILQFVNEGLLHLDEKITKYLKDFRQSTGDQITIRHLLTHTHGIPNPELKSRHAPISTSDFIKRYCENDLEFDPGTSFQYSNVVGYFILGVILEKVSGKEYGTLLNERIFIPLNMNNSGYYDQKSIVENLTTGYAITDGDIHPAEHWDYSQSFSAAGIYTSAYDLFLWDVALRTEKLLPKKYLDMMFTPYKESINYGFGWYINEPVINGKKYKFPAHAGGANGYRSSIIRGIENDLVVIYLSNTDKHVEVRYSLAEILVSDL